MASGRTVQILWCVVGPWACRYSPQTAGGYLSYACSLSGSTRRGLSHRSFEPVRELRTGRYESRAGSKANSVLNDDPESFFGRLRRGYSDREGRNSG